MIPCRVSPIFGGASGGGDGGGVMRVVTQGSCSSSERRETTEAKIAKREDRTDYGQRRANQACTAPTAFPPSGTRRPFGGLLTFVCLPRFRTVHKNTNTNSNLLQVPLPLMQS